MGLSALQPRDPGSIPGRVRPKTVKVVPDASLLGTQHEGLDWGKFPCDILVSCPGGVLSYIKSPHAKETGDRLLPYGPARLEKPRSLKD